MTNRVSVPGRNMSSSQCGIFLNIEKPRIRWRAQAVDAELALDELGVRIGPLAGDAVDPERLHRAGDVQRAVVHGVAEARARVAEDDLAAALHHERGVRARVAAHDDR